MRLPLGGRRSSGDFEAGDGLLTKLSRLEGRPSQAAVLRTVQGDVRSSHFQCPAIPASRYHAHDTNPVEIKPNKRSATHKPLRVTVTGPAKVSTSPTRIIGEATKPPNMVQALSVSGGRRLKNSSAKVVAKQSIAHKLSPHPKSTMDLAILSLIFISFLSLSLTTSRSVQPLS